MNEVQERLLEIIKWFHNYCEQHSFHYYMIDGTMLGAIRHQGFIPWDDDIDVAMPRKDYEAFLRQAEKDLKQNFPYLVESPYTKNEDFAYPFTKLYDTRTTLIENIGPPIKRGLYLDIFPLDGIGKTYKESCKNYKKIALYRKLLCLSLASKRKGRPLYKQLILDAIKKVITRASVRKKINELSRRCDFDNSQYIGNLCGGWGKREIMPREYLGTPQLYNFEGYKFYGVERYDDYLRCVYGDYMTPPPIEKQVSHHSYLLCDLHTSYL